MPSDFAIGDVQKGCKSDRARPQFSTEDPSVQLLQRPICTALASSLGSLQVLTALERSNQAEHLRIRLHPQHPGLRVSLRELQRVKWFTADQPWRARSRLYPSQMFQVNMRLKVLAEIYTMHSFAPFSTLIFFVKNC